MPKVRIISNPYEQEIHFQSWRDEEDVWKDVNSENNENSKLLREKITRGFFPYKVKEILDIIVEEYYVEGNPVEILFEGTQDEYAELAAVANEDEFSHKVTISLSDRVLANARGILPSVIHIFEQVVPLIPEGLSDDEDIKRDGDKFKEASSDDIPICVVGNYSSGKSTFINSLIGYELLPSSDEPTTARIYQIKQSADVNTAYIKFKYNNSPVSVTVTSSSFEMFGDGIPQDILDGFGAEVDKDTHGTIPSTLNIILTYINDLANKMKDDTIADLVEIEAPFDDDGLWKEIPHSFVIFDTPGSNSASNAKHTDVLKEAMRNLSNGLPVFVSQYDSLDSIDNDTLFEMINSMDKLDKRFTMLIINKADSAGLPKGGLTESEREKIRGNAVPKKLNSDSIYFVSSVIGLGSKNDQCFLYDHNDEVFEEKRKSYEDPEHKRYKQLYVYDILPEQIKRKYDAASSVHPNHLYANSGLYSVEQAIQTFAQVYSPYNKCQQASVFLESLIGRVTELVSAAMSEREEHLGQVRSELDAGKKDLIDQLTSKSRMLKDASKRIYPKAMEGTKAEVTQLYDEETLKKAEAEIRRIQSETHDVEGHRSRIWASAKSLLNTFGGNILSAVKEHNASSLERVKNDFVEGTRELAGKVSDYHETSRSVDNMTAEDLLSGIRFVFDTTLESARKALEDTSKEFWTERAVFMREELAQIVTDSSVLSEEKRKELSDIILEYQNVEFDYNTAGVFDKDSFLRKYRDSKRLDIRKLTNTFNEQLMEQISEYYSFLEISHAASFVSWLNNLMANITSNVALYNPRLHEKVGEINEVTARVDYYKSILSKMCGYRDELSGLMSWQEISEDVSGADKEEEAE